MGETWSLEETDTMKLRRLFCLFAGAVLFWVHGPGSAGAGTITYTGNASSVAGDLAAKAIFTTGDGVISVVLSNEVAASVVRNPGQAVSDITFTLSNNAGTLGTQTAAGQFGDISDKPNPGVVTYVASDDQTGDTTPIRWFTGTNAGVSGDTVTLEAIGGGQPSQMIAPFIVDGGRYTNANNGLRNFDSYVIGPATFTLDLSGVTANTTVTAVTFSFGTLPDFFVAGIPGTPAVPEPSTLTLAGIGGLCLTGIGIVRRRRRA
jgi:PEP-CTERM motif